jgi:hypothetical protein
MFCAAALLVAAAAPELDAADPTDERAEAIDESADDFSLRIEETSLDALVAMELIAEVAAGLVVV